MAGRKRSIRFKIFAILLVPVTALVVIWGFAAKLTIEQGQQLLRIQKVYDNVVSPSVRPSTSCRPSGSCR